MAIPSTAVAWPEVMDPNDILDFSVDCSTLLESTESITSYTVAKGPESTLLGLNIVDPTLINDRIYMWLSFSNPADNAFSGSGVSLPIEITINTSKNRRWQRTAVIRAGQK